ncbi:MAG: hypothetical protein AAGC60_12200 [Acidobacteriota bacterium]
MSRFDDVVDQARRGRLYPSVILYGTHHDERRRSALELARALLCEHDDASARGCAPDSTGACGHCRRLLWPEAGAERFHPDLHVLERDLRTSTSVAATKGFLRAAYNAPFEARGQVFIVDEADTLGGGAADALLKLLEEPPLRSPRHFLLLAASRLDLLPTLRSRSLTVFLGGGEPLTDDEVGPIADPLTRALDSFFEAPSPLWLLVAAGALSGGAGWDDPRARRPWARGAAAILRYLEHRDLATRDRRSLLALAEALLDAPRLRLRSITPARILEGLLSQHLGRRSVEISRSRR